MLKARPGKVSDMLPPSPDLSGRRQRGEWYDQEDARQRRHGRDQSRLQGRARRDAVASRRMEGKYAGADGTAIGWLRRLVGTAVAARRDQANIFLTHTTAVQSL